MDKGSVLFVGQVAVQSALGQYREMATAVWTGTLGFGVVIIPVKVYPATQAKDVRFHLIDPATGQRVRYRRVVNKAELPDRESDVATDAVSAPKRPADPARERADVEVAYGDLVRGYEVDEGHFVTLTNDDIEQARPSRSRSIDLEAFVELEDIDPVYFEKSYYLTPRHGAEKPYFLLLRAMQRAGRVGIGRFVLRTKPHLVAIRPLEDLLGLETLYFADEVRDTKGIASGLQAVPVTEREVVLAGQVIDLLKTEWMPESYADEYREELLRMIAERSPSVVEEVEASPASGANIDRLMEALKASVEAAKRGAGEGKRPDRRETG